jgi:predicted SAM-dependent methyltransferase
MLNVGCDKPALAKQIRDASVIRLILGAGNTRQDGWIRTQKTTLNVLENQDWEDALGNRRVAALFAEHVWEHIPIEDVACANRNCFRFLERGGLLRIAVPDGFHPNPKYIRHVRPGGTGPGAHDHKTIYNCRSLSNSLEAAGFTVSLIEYWDEESKFHCGEWISSAGHVRRSFRYDARNSDGKPNYTSLIVDALKPSTA